MLERHPDLHITIQPAQRLYRYVDLRKLLYTLDSGRVFFPTLATMQDIYEGRLTSRTVQEWLSPNLEKEKRTIVTDNICKLNASTNAYLKVLCFSIGDTENEILWNHYGHSEYSVCIQSTFTRIEQALRSTPEAVHAGEIEYVRRDEYLLDNMNIFKIASIKSKEYEAERELRLFVMDPSISSGISIEVDVPTFVDRIILSPKMPDWTLDVLKSVVGKYHSGIAVQKSEIAYRR